MSTEVVSVPQNVLDSVYGSTESDWHQHANGKGWVYKTSHVDESAYLHPTSIVYGNARVSGNARVYGRVYGDARVSGDARVYGRVYGNARVSGNARVYGRVYGDARVSGDARVDGNAWETSPPYLQGSRHALTLCSRTHIAIGCHVHDISYWLEHFKAIGKVERYTEAQIEEYGRHLNYFAEIAKSLIEVDL
ncbi:MAG: polymer-forming cytoskeletal protein [Terracidiphilus sp.]